MSNICAVKPCTRTARALCHCCQQNVCIVHLTEHNDVLINQLNPLIDITNRLSQRLQTIDLDKTFANCRKKLELWRLESHKKIDEFFEQKFHQLDLLINDKINEQQEDINLIQLKIQELIREQQITRQDINDLTLTIDQIEKTINQFDNKFLDIHTYPLILDNNLISIRGINEQEYNLSMLSPIYKIINLSEGSYDSICSNDRYLLIHQSPNLCLIDKDLSIYKRTQWRYEIIYDICWSITLNNFIILDQKNLYLLDENTMSIEKIKINDKKNGYHVHVQKNIFSYRRMNGVHRLRNLI